MIGRKLFFTGLRWAGCAEACRIARPDLVDQLMTGGELSAAWPLLGYYVCVGMVAEFAYRRVAWGNLVAPRDHEGTAKNPWRSFTDAKPVPEREILVRCADGNVRRGRRVSAVLVYIFLGDQIALAKKIRPEPTRRISCGKLDVGWGFKYLYWTLWWPLYLRRAE